MNKPLNLYEKLFIRGYEVGEGKGAQPNVRDPDLALAYHALIHMRRSLVMCRALFDQYLMEDLGHETDTMTLVERLRLKERIARHRGIVQSIDAIVKTVPELPADDWKPIATAAQDTKPVRLLGKREDGSTYVETGVWANIKWSVETLRGHQAPTHWMPVERLPEGY